MAVGAALLARRHKATKASKMKRIRFVASCEPKLRDEKAQVIDRVSEAVDGGWSGRTRRCRQSVRCNVSVTA